MTIGIKYKNELINVSQNIISLFNYFMLLVLQWIMNLF